MNGNTEFLDSLPRLLKDLLIVRGFETDDKAHRFLYPQLSDFPDPMNGLLDLDEALKILIHAREYKELVVVFGDYDVDGASSTALLVGFLRDLGWNVDFYIPHRVNEGYGMTLKAVENLLKRKPECKVVLSCDCGIASFDGIEFLRQNSKRVIVTDHHEVPEVRVNADAVINPKQKSCPYPDKKLAGVGVAFLLVVALRRALGLKEFSLRSYLDLVALATVCDLAELVGANRILVKSGLQVLNSSPRLGLQVLAKVAGCSASELKAQDLGFVIGPRLNAGGRVGDPEDGVKLLLARDEEEALPIALKLEAMNRKRRELQAAQTEAAIEALESDSRMKHRRSIFIYDESFHLGLVGLIASRIAEKFRKPCCVMTKLEDEHALANLSIGSLAGANEIWKGSMRTPAGYHLANALKEIQGQDADLLLSGGGHAMAAGVSVLGGRLEEFQKQFEISIAAQGSTTTSEEYDLILTNTDSIERVLEFWEPVGQGNPAPQFLLQNFKIKSARVLKEEHIKLQGEYLGQNWSVLQFRSPWVRLFNEIPQSGVQLDFVGELLQNDWRGRKTLEWKMKELIKVMLHGELYDFGARSNEISASASPR